MPNLCAKCPKVVKSRHHLSSTSPTLALDFPSKYTPTPHTPAQVPIVPIRAPTPLTLLRALTRAARATPQCFLPHRTRIEMRSIRRALSALRLPGLPSGRRREPSIRRPADQRVVIADHCRSARGRRIVVGSD